MTGRTAARNAIHSHDHPQSARRVRQRWLTPVTIALAWLGVMADARAQTTNHIYVPYPNESAVRRIETAPPQDIGLDSTWGAPSCVAIRRDGLGYYISAPDVNEIYRVLGGSLSSFATIPVQCIALSPNQARLYATSGNALVVLDANDGSTVAIVPNVGLDPRGVSVSPDGSRVYVSLFGQNSIAVVETAGHTVIADMPVGPGPGHVAISPDGTVGLVAETLGTRVWRLDLQLNAPNIFFIGHEFHAIAFKPDGTGAYASNRDSGAIHFLASDGSSSSVFAATTFANGPIAVTPDGNHIWAINNGNGNARSFSTADGSETVALAFPGFTVASSTGQIMGPTVINGTLPSIAGDAALTALGFEPDFLPFANGSLVLSGSFTSARTLSLVEGTNTIDTNGHDASFQAGMIGFGSFVKSGAGRLIVDGAATHQQTNIYGGTMEINGVHVYDVMVASGTTLAGAGTLGNINVDFGAARVSPGSASSTGILTSTGTVSFAPGSILSIRLNGPVPGTSYDRLASSGGTIDLVSSSTALDVSLGYTPRACRRICR